MLSLFRLFQYPMHQKFYACCVSFLVQDWWASLSDMKLAGRVLPMGDDTALESSDESVIVT